MNNLCQDCVSHLNEEATHTDAYKLSVPGVEEALLELRGEFSTSFLNEALLKQALEKSRIRVAHREALHADTVRFDVVIVFILWLTVPFEGSLGPRDCTETNDACKSHVLE